MTTDDGRMGLTRWRDLAVVCLVAAVAGYLLVRVSYARIPPLPRLAGLLAALLGVGEAVAGFGLRRRIRPPEQTAGAPAPRPVEPLTAARAVMVAKATALAGAALAGLWLGLLGFVLPSWADVAAARADGITGFVGLAGAVVMVAGALFLERSCLVPKGR
ncbi:DUF3180 domain-containing protein [Nakamurella sp.]|uniref:DUF3180 domain-containing protein n=1 Tax=Nakamurella sp. TaxID=1869182 RepID=UPI003B3A6D9B